ncbi:hypothetical protein PVAP13_5KG258507 [Panicum virgatum]|uniref:Uncharacterized protein n=1 Tax=Panicum virgatum TaxID=38727 RepID=A0A8T0SK17_PANVG|nr:hypothetical protein PVAP13_5KG258507 [Panicum virgatum]
MPPLLSSAAMEPKQPKQPEHAEQPEQQPEPVQEPRRRRGPTTGETYCKKVKGPQRKIEFGADGNTTGRATGSFVSFLGQTARDHVPINFEDWKTVPMEIKGDC